MFYFIFVFVILSVFLLIKGKNSRAVRCSILMMTCYIAALLVFILYISKDSFYYNVIDYLFSVPLPIWNRIMFISVPFEALIRLLNFFTLSAIFFSVQFALAYRYPKVPRRYSIVILCIFIVEFIIYDPKVCELLYLTLYPEILTWRQFSFLQNAAHITTVVLNNGLLLFSLYLLWQNYRKVSHIRLIKISTAGIGICHALITISYIGLFGYYPVCLVKISKTAGIVSYVTAPIAVNKWFTRLFPYYLMLSFLLICFCIYQTTLISAQLENESFTISKQISATDTTSKVFCHYLKNEIMAIQSEVEILDAADEQQRTAFHEIEQRCSYLYERLDFLYKSSKFTSLTLKETDLRPVLFRLTENFSHELQECTVAHDFPEEPVIVLLDETWFYQALHNIVSNAIDAMTDVPAGCRALSLSLDYVDSYVCIRITDTGKGIAPEDLPHIFTPFYSSHPIRTHWGIGLSLTYKVITAHEGHIDVESKPNAGTTVKVLLPQLRPKSRLSSAREAAVKNNRNKKGKSIITNRRHSNGKKFY